MVFDLDIGSTGENGDVYMLSHGCRNSHVIAVKVQKYSLGASSMAKLKSISTWQRLESNFCFKDKALERV